MKYLSMMVFSFLLVLSSCCIDDIDQLQGSYALISYSILDCDIESNNQNDNLKSTSNDCMDIKIAGSEFCISGQLEIKFDGSYDQEVIFNSSAGTIASFTDSSTGKLGNTEEKNTWVSECCLPFFEDCEVVDASLNGDVLIWNIEDENNCVVQLLWQKN